MRKRILLICQTMTYFSGSPLYHYTLAKELNKQGHDVSVYSMWVDNELRNGLGDDGIMTMYDKPSGKYDLVLISQLDHKGVLDNIQAKKVINIIHSEYDVETPITDRKIDQYVAIRPEIKNHLIYFHNIPEEKIKVVYNGIDLNKFNPKNRVINTENFTKVVLPCTLDMLRKKFLEYYASKASERYRVYIYGKDYANNFSFRNNPWVFVKRETFNIEDCIKDADLVAGILLGRINLEARAMGIVSYIHDPENPSEFEVFFPNDEEFEDRHNIEKVAKRIIE